MKTITIKSCFECSRNVTTLGLKGLRCGASGRKAIDNPAVIPDWCPRQDRLTENRQQWFERLLGDVTPAEIDQVCHEIAHDDTTDELTQALAQIILITPWPEDTPHL